MSFVFQCACPRVLPGLSYDCRADIRDVQGHETGPIAKEEIQNGNSDAQPDTPGYEFGLTQQGDCPQPDIDSCTADCERYEQYPQRKQECHLVSIRY